MTRKSEAGQALVLGLVILSLFLIGVAGLGIDMGYMRYEKRLMQTAADAAAIAGASNLCTGCSGVISGAQAAAVTNGFTDSSSNKVSTCTNDAPTTKATKPPTVCVQINNPPTSGPHSGDTKYVEAYVSVVEPTFFMALLGTYSEPVTARAVATYLSGANNSGGCLYTLAPPTGNPEGISTGGSSDLTANGCGINDNGNFSGKSITAGSISVSAATGSASGVTCTVTPTSCPTYGAPAAANPLSYLTPPTVGTPQSFSCPGTGAVPGTYSGVTFTGNTNCNFNPGIYVLTGGFTCHGTPTITGTGVMFYLTNGSNWDCSGNDTVNFTAPSPTNCPACPSEDDGILIYQDPADTATDSLGGNVGSTFGGAIYAPTAEIDFKGNSSGISAGIVVAAAFGANGNPSVTLLGAAGLPSGVAIIKDAVLVE